jgi:hypothetical protein
MAIASVTRLKLRSNRFMLPFLWHAVTSMFQAKRADGCLAATAGRRGEGFWTITVWRDADALKAFMLRGPHRKAMPHLVEWCDEAATARFAWNSHTLPSWDEAEWRMASEGRLSPVKHPSPAHAGGNTLGGDGLKATLRKPVQLQS